MQRPRTGPESRLEVGSLRISDRKHIRVGAFLLFLVSCASGCVSAEHAEVEAAKQEKARCVATQGETHPECRALDARIKAAQETYEVRSRQAWGCDPALQQCPTPR